MSTTETAPEQGLLLDLAPPPAPAAQRLGIEAAIAIAAESPAVAAMLRRRGEQIVKGYTAAADLEGSPYSLARKTQDQLSAATDRLLGGCPTLEALAIALRRTEIVGAMAMALHDRIRAEMKLREAEDRAEAANAFVEDDS
jgi:hypothetical protein